ncbi:MAG: hypothetical protein MJZ94_10095 [Bacteroidales bacterium]|nr:hypothetical protein [Bacteroidales bacterium]
MKTVLFLDGTYCDSIGKFTKILCDKLLNKSFKKELLAAYKDGVLYGWLNDRDGNKAKLLSGISKDSDDNDLLRQIYKVVTGNECTENLDSKFSEIAELIRCEVDGNEVQITDKSVKITNYKAKEIKFVFKTVEENQADLRFELVGDFAASKTRKKGWYLPNSEFSISFPLDIRKVKTNNVVSEFECCQKDGRTSICSIEVQPERRAIWVKAKTVYVYHIFGENSDFWITEPQSKSDATAKYNWLDREIRWYLENPSIISSRFLEFIQKNTHHALRIPTKSELDEAYKSGKIGSGGCYAYCQPGCQTRFYDYGKSKDHSSQWEGRKGSIPVDWKLALVVTDFTDEDCK